MSFSSGDPELQVKQHDDWQTILALCGTLQDPRLRQITQMFLKNSAIFSVAPPPPAAITMRVAVDWWSTWRK